MCAGQQGKFFEFHDLLFANQTGENIGDFAERRLYAMADVVGLEPDAFDACYRDPATGDAVDQDKAAGLRAGVNSTPSFQINGTPFLGAQPYAEFQKAIDAALDRRFLGDLFHSLVAHPGPAGPDGCGSSLAHLGGIRGVPAWCPASARPAPPPV